MTQVWEYIKIALMNIRSNKGRSILTMLGIIIGISSVIMIISIGNGGIQRLQVRHVKGRHRLLHLIRRCADPGGTVRKGTAFQILQLPVCLRQILHPLKGIAGHTADSQQRFLPVDIGNHKIQDSPAGVIIVLRNQQKQIGITELL